MRFMRPIVHAESAEPREVLSAGGQTDPNSNNRAFFDEGSFFLTGTIGSGQGVVPEPASFAMLLGGLIALVVMGRRTRG